MEETWPCLLLGLFEKVSHLFSQLLGGYNGLKFKLHLMPQIRPLLSSLSVYFPITFGRRDGDKGAAGKLTHSNDSPWEWWERTYITWNCVWPWFMWRDVRSVTEYMQCCLPKGSWCLPSRMQTWLCGTPLSLMPQKDQFCSDSHSPPLSPTTPSA